ncbi:DUF3558 domain-containing protein [Rhodococcus kroppenstedtii]|uniref:DUF3558 domain-containing protein n=1 Tax=Rhodococcoides kroppenstedtii TaxID=293050 RepID=A0A1I0TKR9_9NOCA|nr:MULTISPECIES: DUF3558 domain-containing protein [Rhodococcus]AMY17802.1 Putative lipoprotein LprB [Rhodococcus sp. PBTS 1]MBT1190896.1 DUF3558 domain-containing protein [Rhodococcus kroppenstedtii]MBY6315092.1 DUF3558 domain-containing protein [Rhodococcus kroppenstedtii]MBY6321605.1 DUF3558 domain-containing protein [Rhodococcus kroppenstedtii]MBY6400613.1 DUF3558 domain-containing protein [Rhodococcus kroppenstedtii]
MRPGRWAAGLAAAAALTACGGTSDTAAGPTTTTAAAQPGPFFGVCGQLTDDEVRQAFAVPAFATVTRNSVGCEWEVSGPTGPSVSFSWYRGSPIGRERAGSELIGRPAADLEIAGRSGFEALYQDALGQPVLCESALQYGSDFVHLSVTYADVTPTADPCVVGRQLLETVAERAQ